MQFRPIRSLLSCCAVALLAPSLSRAEEPAPKTLLVLGGTGFSGPHVVEEARSRGFTVTLFNRGKANPHLFPELERLRGDRDPEVGDGLKALEGRRFDAVIDTSGHVPRHMRASCELLADSGFYVFVSSLSAYADHATPGADEDAPLAELPEHLAGSEDFRGEAFGPLKALCEKEVLAAFPGRSAVVRPGLIVGPGDWSDRFTYWVARADRGGEILAPGTGDDPVKVIDAKDLAAFLVTLAENRTAGVFNAIGPDRTLTIREVVETCVAAAGKECTVTWVDAGFLESQGVAPWTNLPLWLPSSGETAGFHTRSIARGVAAGLTFRPLDETVAETLTWVREWPAERASKPLRNGLTPEREAEILAAWREKKA
jgi:2'-hydroxyisoflavone reductase